MSLKYTKKEQIIKKHLSDVAWDKNNYVQNMIYIHMRMAMDEWEQEISDMSMEQRLRNEFRTTYKAIDNNHKINIKHLIEDFQRQRMKLENVKKSLEKISKRYDDSIVYKKLLRDLNQVIKGL